MASGVSGRRIIIIGADGLRPDLLDPALLPTVAGLAARGVRFRDHHSVYPSHTRVVMSALATGTTPGRHGIVANTMLAPFGTEDHIIDTGDYQHLDALDRASDGRMLLTAGLGDLVGQHGGRVAVAGNGSPGSSLLWTRNDRGRIINPTSALGLADLYDLREKLGAVPPPGQATRLERLDYVTRAVTDIFLGDPTNRVIVLWLNEPDSSFHYYGLGAPEAVAALRAVDASVAAVLAELDRRGLRDQFDLLFMSDHGHSTVAAHQTLREYLARAAADLDRPLPPLATASDYIYAQPGTEEPSTADLAPLVAWLVAQPWAGVVLGGRPDLAALPGVIPLERVWNGATNPRRPLLAVSPRWSHTANEHGVPGTVMSLTTQSALRSSHGSASPYDMHPVLIAHGPSFREGLDTTLPSGVTDVLPTVLTLLGLPLPAGLDGRVLWEGLRHPAGEPGAVGHEVVEPSTSVPNGAPSRVRLERVGGTTYLHGALQPATPDPFLTAHLAASPAD
jgi:arylsulfatase A-like enzyme